MLDMLDHAGLNLVTHRTFIVTQYFFSFIYLFDAIFVVVIAPVKVALAGDAEIHIDVFHYLSRSFAKIKGHRGHFVFSCVIE